MVLTLSVMTYEQIRDHNAALIKSLHESILKLRMVPKHNRPQYVHGTIGYQVHAINALRWSTKIAQQRAGVKIDANDYNRGAIEAGCQQWSRDRVSKGNEETGRNPIGS